jgi:hypothetical protein
MELKKKETTVENCGWVVGIGGEGRRDKLHVSELWEGWVGGWERTKGWDEENIRIVGGDEMGKRWDEEVVRWVVGGKIDADTIISPH